MKKKDGTKRKWWRRSKEEMRSRPYATAVYFVLRFIVLAMLMVNLWERDYESAFICVLSLILFFLPAFIEKQFRVQIPTLMEVVILLFIFGAEILGELQNYYTQYSYWDTMLHTTNGFVCAAFGFSLIDILTRNRREKFRLSPLYVSLVAFCFSMTVGVLWEFFEYGMDVSVKLLLKAADLETVRTALTDLTAGRVLFEVTGETMRGAPDTPQQGDETKK